MVSNHTSMVMGRLVTLYPAGLGHLYSPGGERGPWPWMPYALDNGAYSAFKNGRPFDVPAWLSLLDWAKASGVAPLWTLVPDVVGDCAATLRAWDTYAPIAASYGWPLAFAAQDGMEPIDVPAAADVVFIGGSTAWKREAIVPWCRAHRRVHVGRINTRRWVEYCEAAGAESCDGTGWTRGDLNQWGGLLGWLDASHGAPRPCAPTSSNSAASAAPAAPGRACSAATAPAAVGDATT